MHWQPVISDFMVKAAVIIIVQHIKKLKNNKHFFLFHLTFFRLAPVSSD